MLVGTAREWRGIMQLLLLIVLMIAAGVGCGGGDGSPPPPAPDTQSPSAPVGLNAVAASDTKVNLQWVASTDNVAVTGYVITRNSSEIATVTTTSYADTTGLMADTTYTYTVKAKDAAGNVSAPSASASAKTLAAGTTDTQAPTVPSDLAASASGASSIDLTWGASTDNVGVLGYNVYRADSASGTPAKVGSTTLTSFSNTGLAASTTYYYTVKAYDGANNESLASNQTNATTWAAGTKTLTVKVRDNYYAPVKGVTVVLGDSTGAMASPTSYQVTDASGDVVFANPPADATVTFARSAQSKWNPSMTNYVMQTYYNVNRSTIAIQFNDNGIPWSSIGTASITVNNNISAVNWRIFPNWGWGSPSQNPANVNIYQADIQSDGKVSFVVLGVDANWDVIGFGTALDQTFTSSMNPTINLNQTTFSTVNHTVANVPNTAMGVSCNTSQSQKNGQDIWVDSFAASIAGTTTCVGRAVPGYGDSLSYEYSIGLDKNSNGTEDAYYGAWKGYTTAAFAAWPIDLNTFPPILAGATISGGSPRPTLSWTGSSTGADDIYGSLFYTNNTTSQYEYQFDAPPSRTSVQFPQLPDSLAAFIPTWIGNSGVSFSLENDDLVGIATYDELLALLETWSLGNGSGTLESHWSGLSYTNGVTPAPKKSKPGLSASASSKRSRFFQK
jgi:chitodextrinase